MNIFVLDEDPIKAAQMLCDKHICKMIVESCQLLCSVFYFNSNIVPQYKLTHKNHPCAKWARLSKANFEWLLKHLRELLNQYTLRYYKKHKCEQVYNWINEHKIWLNFNYFKLTSFIQCMPDKYRYKDTVQAYKNYYIGEKLKFAKWKLGNIPKFVKEYYEIINYACDILKLREA